MKVKQIFVCENYTIGETEKLINSVLSVYPQEDVISVRFSGCWDEGANATVYRGEVLYLEDK